MKKTFKDLIGNGNTVTAYLLMANRLDMVIVKLMYASGSIKDGNLVISNPSKTLYIPLNKIHSTHCKLKDGNWVFLNAKDLKKYARDAVDLITM